MNFAFFHLHMQLADNFKSIEGIKLKKHNELMVQIALLYFCIQLLLHAVKYFLVLPFGKYIRNASDIVSDGSNGITLVAINRIDE